MQTDERGISSGPPSGAQSLFEAPRIALPTGGGAIRGIDEKFTANPATGTGAVSIPLALSPGRNGFGPQLTLRYDSGSGNGPFGIGWSLDIPHIGRRTDKGLPRYGDSEDSDIFVLSGAEDLVPDLLRDDQEDLRIAEFERDGYRVRHYRPRVEGLFARIERWTCCASGVSHWRSISRDNVLTVYGYDAESRIADPDEPTHVFDWLICRSYDDRGNAIRYDYVAEDDRGVETGRPSECSRQHRANRYLKRIRYGNRSPMHVDREKPGGRAAHTELGRPDDSDWMFEAVFDYGEDHSQDTAADEDGRVFTQGSIEPQCHWTVRRDSFSTYRSGFEVRTHRLCRRVLMFHRFERELGLAAALVRSTVLDYHERPNGSFLVRGTARGHRHLGQGRYLTRAQAPVEFFYTQSPLENPLFDRFELKDVQPENLENLPAAVGTTEYRFVDLDGEGIPGILAEQDDTWFYKPNRGEGRFGGVSVVSLQPSTANLSAGQQQLMDLAGDGTLDLVEFGPAGGYYERTDDAKWKGFRPFRSLPVEDWANPNLRFVDLTGDGIADVLVTEDDAFTWHRALGEEGFGPGVRVAAPLEERLGPRVVFGDGTQSIYLADMTGDGLADLVRIRNGGVCYWPNTGYGRFGTKIVMEHAPWFDDADLFDQGRVRLADTDGSGTTDIVYLGRDAVQIYLNEVGNAWRGVRELRAFPRVDDLASVTVMDFLGRGTACLLWSSSLPSDHGRHVRYVDLMCGVKPHLLDRVVNNLGAETHIRYASSTQFYLADKAAGNPWITRLPFPVHVVERVETWDDVSCNRFVTRYSYYHGFYDRREREFRGFGRVDQFDTEEIGALGSTGDAAPWSNTDAAASIPPVLTRTWFHTGVFHEGNAVSRHLASEYYREGAARSGEHPLPPPAVDAMLLDDTVLPPGLTPEETREACRALKGTVLRREVYALDGKPESVRPYSVAESNFTVRLVQQRGRNRHAVLFIHAREEVNFAYERKLYTVGGCLRADPRVSHNVALEVDEFGNVLKSVAIAYGRRLAAGCHDFQRRTFATLTESDHTNPVDLPDAHRTPLPAEQRLYELRGLAPASQIPGVTNLFRFGELAEKVALLSEICPEISFEHWRYDDGRVGRRLLKKARTQYRANDLHGLLPPGQLESMALPGEAFTVAMPAAELPELPDTDVAALQAEGGYVDLDGVGTWWIPSGRAFYCIEPERPSAEELRQAATHFYTPRRYVDPFGNVTAVVFDPHDLLPVETTDALGSVARAEIDYRVLAPWRLTDPNGNRSEAAFDALGLVSGTAVRGKEGEPDGDTLDGFEPDPTPQVVHAFLDDPRGRCGPLLGGATTRILYDNTRYLACRKPAFAATIVRETHESDLDVGQQTRTQVRVGFSDGFGREIQIKMQAEPGSLAPGGGDVAERWAGSGWTIFNNKGSPVRKYEPFFSASPDFEFAKIEGVSPILLYDPLSRVIATLHPDHTFEKVVFDPWWQAKWDANDTVLLDPAADLDVGDLVTRLPQADYLPTWYGGRITGAHGEAERDAAQDAARHADTPATIHLDALGRSLLIIADNGIDAEGRPAKYATLSVLDIEGNARDVIDPLGRSVMRYDYDMAGRRIRQVSMDAGAQATRSDIAGKPIRVWSSRRCVFRTEYDALRRPVRHFVQGGDPYERGASPLACEILFERTIYGDSPESGLTEHRQRAANLRGRSFRHFDAAGVTTTDQYDFKGNLLRSVRQFVREYRSVPDWSETPKFDLRRFEALTTYDALNRVVTGTGPDGSIHRPTYNESGLVERIDVALHAQNCPSPLEWSPFIRDTEYNARGQRTRVAYGNGATSVLHFDPVTFRLIRLRTTRPTDREALPVLLFADAAVVQDLRYHYDPVGNVSQLADRALRTVFHDNHRIDPVCRYRYDALYRLVAATGREHAQQSAFRPSPPDGNDRDYPYAGAAARGDLQALETYTESYEYDPVGNFLRTAHRSLHGSWTRRYAYDEPSCVEPARHGNRLSHTRVGSDGSGSLETYLYDASGNVVQMPHLPVMRWDFLERLAASARQVVNCGTPETTYYVYDAGGTRVRKVTETADGKRKSERLYLGGFELYHEFTAEADAPVLERETVHVMDGDQRVAIVEMLTIDRDDPLLSVTPLQRFQLANHLGSASVELDDAASLISYEEYSPYGSSVFQVGRSVAEVKLKRYRYTGKERDVENGFTYHGARYCAPWLGRWISCDPAGIADGLNIYQYAQNRPLILVDGSGLDSVLNLLAEDARAQREKDFAERLDNDGQAASDVPPKVDSLPGGVADAPEGGTVPEYTADQDRIKAQDQAASGFVAGVENSAIELVQSVVKQPLEQAGGPLNPLTEAAMGKVDSYFNSYKVRPENSDASAAGYFAGAWFFNTALILITAGGMRAFGGGAGSGGRGGGTPGPIEPPAPAAPAKLPTHPLDLPTAPGAKTVAAGGGDIQLSGYGWRSETPGSSTSFDVLGEANARNLPINPAKPGFLDQGTKGLYGASHAEAKVATRNPFLRDISVSKTPCMGHCQPRFQGLASQAGESYRLHTPGGTFVFTPQGSVWRLPLEATRFEFGLAGILR